MTVIERCDMDIKITIDGVEHDVQKITYDMKRNGRGIIFHSEGKQYPRSMYHDCDTEGHIWGAWSNAYQVQRTKVDYHEEKIFRSSVKTPIWNVERTLKQSRNCTMCNLYMEREVN